MITLTFVDIDFILFYRMFFSVDQEVAENYYCMLCYSVAVRPQCTVYCIYGILLLY